MGRGTPGEVGDGTGTRPVPVVRVGPLTHPGHPRGNPNPTGIFGSVPRPSPDFRVDPRIVSDLREGPQPCPKPPVGCHDPSWTSSWSLNPFRTSQRVHVPSMISPRVPLLVPYLWECPRPVPNIPEGPPTHPGPSAVSLDQSWTSKRVPQPIPNIREGPQNCPGPSGGSHDPS